MDKTEREIFLEYVNANTQAIRKLSDVLAVLVYEVWNDAATNTTKIEKLYDFVMKHVIMKWYMRGQL